MTIISNITLSVTRHWIRENTPWKLGSMSQSCCASIQIGFSIQFIFYVDFHTQESK